MRRIPVLRLALLAAPLVASAYAQAPSVPDAYVPTMTFDVASVRQSPEAESYRVGGSFAGPHSGSANFSNLNIANLLGSAYGVRRAQIVGLPDDRVMFNIQAKTDAATEQRLAGLTLQQVALEHQHMMQALLAERFKLKVHWEDRGGPIFNLVLARGGPKLVDGASAAPDPNEVKAWGDKPVPTIYQRGSSMKAFDFIAHGCSMAEIVSMLASQAGRPVIDKTGLTGTYSFILHYHGAFLADRAADDLDPVPPLDLAIQQQLGLKLESAKGTNQVLVIDHIEKPSEN